MRALITTPSGPAMAERPECQIAARHEVKIQVCRGAICRTDLYVARGEIPVNEGTVLGHEAAGIIVDRGSEVSGLQVGERVVIDPLQACGRCPDCQSGNRHDCVHSLFMGIDRDGAFADYVVTPEGQVRLIPSDLSFDLAVYAEPIAATRSILQPLQAIDEPVLIYGSGRIARLTRQILAAAGHRDLTVSTTPGNQRYGTVIEAVDCGTKIADALNALKPGGRLILKSRHPTNISLPLLATIKNRFKIEAVYYSRFDEALSYLSEHREFIASLLGNCWPLQSYRDAFAEASASEALKTIFAIAD